MALMMTGIAITSLMDETQKKRWASITWDNATLLLLYLLNSFLLFLAATS
ncbi:MAG TPA: hypothetical protein VML36_07770 [Nitrospiria bacterium]|nr:hypothetical protein [Nitrospiria bacterium]